MNSFLHGLKAVIKHHTNQLRFFKIMEQKAAAITAPIFASFNFKAP